MIAAVTMVWNDNWFLARWVNYFGENLGRKNLYIILHGEDDAARKIATGCNIFTIPRETVGIDFDVTRWEFLSNFTNALLKFYDTVLTLDVDELILPANRNASLAETLGILEKNQNWCVAGFELFPDNPGCEDYTDGKKIASQCSYALFSPFYSKACVAHCAVSFSPGGHGLVGEKPSLNHDLVLLHLRFVSTAELERRRRLRVGIADAAYEAGNTDVHKMKESGRLVSWKEAERRHRNVFKQFDASEPMNWRNGLQKAHHQLVRLQYEHNNRFLFKPVPREAIRLLLPAWIRDKF